MMTAPIAAPKNIATTDSTLLANLGLLPFAIEESAAMPVIVSVRTVVVRSGIANFRTAAVQTLGIWLGGVWSEQVEGTNGIGTAIVEQRPVLVHCGQHFRTRHANLSCAGAPIFDADNKLIAVLDASRIDLGRSVPRLPLSVRKNLPTEPDSFKT